MGTCNAIEWLRNIPTKIVSGDNANCPNYCCNSCSCGCSKPRPPKCSRCSGNNN